MQPGTGDSTCLVWPVTMFFSSRMDLDWAVIELERGVDLAAALDGLLVEFVGAAFGAIEVRLELIAGVEEQVDGANGVGVGGESSRGLRLPQSGSRRFRRERHASH